MKKIGITGGIGSGKSLVCSYIRSQGYLIIDADALVADLLENADIMEKIEKLLGRECIKNGKVDKKKISDIIFSDKNAYNSYMTMFSEYVVKKIEELLKKYETSTETKKNAVFLDAPLIYEYGFDKNLDEVFYIDRNLDDRIADAASRDDSTPCDVKKRMSEQIGVAIARKKGATIINNNGSIEELMKKIDDILISRLGKR